MSGVRYSVRVQLNGTRPITSVEASTPANRDWGRSSREMTEQGLRDGDERKEPCWTNCVVQDDNASVLFRTPAIGAAGKLVGLTGGSVQHIAVIYIYIYLTVDVGESPGMSTKYVSTKYLGKVSNSEVLTLNSIPGPLPFLASWPLGCSRPSGQRGRGMYVRTEFQRSCTSCISITCKLGVLDEFSRKRKSGSRVWNSSGPCVQAASNWNRFASLAARGGSVPSPDLSRQQPFVMPRSNKGWMDLRLRFKSQEPTRKSSTP